MKGRQKNRKIGFESRLVFFQEESFTFRWNSGDHEQHVSTSRGLIRIHLRNSAIECPDFFRIEYCWRQQES